MLVMAGLVPAIHALAAVKTWMPGTSPGMTNAFGVRERRDVFDRRLHHFDSGQPPSPADNIGLGSENVIGAELRKTSTQPGTFPGVLINVGTFVANSAGGRVNEIRANAADPGQAVAPLGANGFNIPALLSVAETAPYFYSGLAQTLDEVLNGSQDGNGGTRHHFVTDPAQRAQLIQFLRSIDDTTPIFP